MFQGIKARMAEARRQAEGVELPDAPVTRERFTVSVEQNHSTAGLGTMSGFKWRWTVTDAANGRLQKSDYALTSGMAQSLGNVYIGGILSGKHPVK